MTNLGKTKDYLYKTIELGSLCVYRKGICLKRGLIVDIKKHVGIVELTETSVSEYKLDHPEWVQWNEVVQIDDRQVFDTMSAKMLMLLATTRGIIKDKVVANQAKHEKASARAAKKRLAGKS